MKNIDVMGPICAAFAATALMAAGANAQPLPEGEELEVVQAEVTPGGVSLTLRSTETTGPAVVGLRTLDGNLLGEMAFAIAPGVDEIVTLPLPVDTVDALLELDLDLAGARRIAGLSITPHCTIDTAEDGVVEAYCTQTATVTNAVNSALPFSDAARAVIDSGVLELDGFGGLDGQTQDVIGEVIRYSRRTTIEPVDVGECDCEWTLSNSDGVKYPDTEQKDDTTWDDGYLHYAYRVGEGAVLDAELKHRRHYASTQRRGDERSPGGSTSQTLSLDCWTVVAHQIVRIYIHVPPNPPVLISETIYPVHGDERCNDCQGVVHYKMIGYVDATTVADRVGTSWTSATANSTLVASIGGESMNISASASSKDCFAGCGNTKGGAADDDPGAETGSTTAPLTIEADADIYLKVSGEGKDNAIADASVSYGYAFNAQAGCGAGGIFGYESASHNKAIEASFCSEIENFLAQRGITRECK